VHERTYAEAVLPSETFVLGLRMRPYAIGHELWLTRQGNPILGTGPVEPRHAYEAALICSEDWAGTLRLNRDPFLPAKIRLWKWRTRKYDLSLEVAEWRNYREAGSLAFRLHETANGKRQSRSPGAPFLLRLVRMLMTQHRLTEAQALDYPLGLAQMHYEAWLEEEGAVEIWNEADQQFEDYIREREAKCQV